MVLTACVAETVFTGLAGGGFAIYHDEDSGETTCLDFFVAVPGLAGRRGAVAGGDRDRLRWSARALLRRTVDRGRPGDPGRGRCHAQTVGPAAVAGRLRSGAAPRRARRVIRAAALEGAGDDRARHAARRRRPGLRQGRARPPWRCAALPPRARRRGARPGRRRCGGLLHRTASPRRWWTRSATRATCATRT